MCKINHYYYLSTNSVTLGILIYPGESWWIPIVDPGGSSLWILVDPHCGSQWIPVEDPDRGSCWILVDPSGGSSNGFWFCILDPLLGQDHTGPYGIKWWHAVPYGTNSTIWDHMVPYSTNWYHTVPMGPYRTIRYHIGPCRTIRDHMGPYGTIRDHKVPYGTIQYHMGAIACYLTLMVKGRCVTTF